MSLMEGNEGLGVEEGGELGRGAWPALGVEPVSLDFLLPFFSFRSFSPLEPSSQTLLTEWVAVGSRGG